MAFTLSTLIVNAAVFVYGLSVIHRVGAKYFFGHILAAPLLTLNITFVFYGLLTLTQHTSLAMSVVLGGLVIAILFLLYRLIKK